jgi:hypothetical protein
MACGALRQNATVGGKRRRNRRNNVSMRKRRNNVSMRKRRNNWASRRNNMMRRMMYGGYESVPSPTVGNSMATMEAQSLAQGQQFASMHKNQHGGALAPADLSFSGKVQINPIAPAPPGPGVIARTPPPGVTVPMRAMPPPPRGGGGLDAGPFPGAVVSPSVLPENLHASARVAPLDAAIKEIQGLKDQSGGKRRGKKSRKSSKKSKKTRKGRKGRKGMRGGAWSMDNAQSVSAPGMILPPGLEARAVSGMNAEWKLAENPKAFAPGYASY